ncbi:Potassium/sodium hyperpolarization-activated cyclic nucleotide-gated channel 3, partial [Geodia barretti]
MAHSATSATQHSYLDVFGDRLPSRFPVPEEAAESSRPKPAAKCFIEPSPSNPIRVPLRKKVKCFFTDVWNTRISMKLFGSRKELEMEEERLQNIEYLVIHPCSKFRILWDIVMLLILSINTVLLPVAVSFFRELINPGWLSFTCFSDMLFIIDIVLNFWTGVITDENIVILDLRMIRRIYVKRWLLFDILSVFPFDYMAIIIIEANSLSAAYLQATTALRLLRLLKLLSLLRLFRVVKLMHYLAKWEELFNANSPIARISNFILGVLLLAHWNGCIQFLVPFMEGFPPDSWVSINHLQYSWAVFKAISHMLCIGFGRFPPQNITEVWVTIISMLIGASLYAMFIGHISTLIHSADSSSRKYKEKKWYITDLNANLRYTAQLEQVEEYARYRKLPLAMKQKVYEYYYQRYHGHMFNEQDILNELSHPLMVEILNYTCQELIRVVPFFASASEAFITSIITRVSFDVFLPGDYVTQYGTIGTKMYFIQHGVLDV